MVNRAELTISDSVSKVGVFQPDRNISVENLAGDYSLEWPVKSLRFNICDEHLAEEQRTGNGHQNEHKHRSERTKHRAVMCDQGTL
jgi:hypothetical protein